MYKQQFDRFQVLVYNSGYRLPEEEDTSQSSHHDSLRVDRLWTNLHSASAGVEGRAENREISEMPGKFRQNDSTSPASPQRENIFSRLNKTLDNRLHFPMYFPEGPIYRCYLSESEYKHVSPLPVDKFLNSIHYLFFSADFRHIVLFFFFFLMAIFFTYGSAESNGRIRKTIVKEI